MQSQFGHKPCSFVWRTKRRTNGAIPGRNRRSPAFLSSQIGPRREPQRPSRDARAVQSRSVPALPSRSPLGLNFKHPDRESTISLPKRPVLGRSIRSGGSTQPSNPAGFCMLCLTGDFVSLDPLRYEFCGPGLANKCADLAVQRRLQSCVTVRAI